LDTRCESYHFWKIAQTAFIVARLGNGKSACIRASQLDAADRERDARFFNWRWVGRVRRFLRRRAASDKTICF
jgi:hypothetical protein